MERARFGNKTFDSRKSQIWHCHLRPFLATRWKEPDLETKHYCHFWEFLGTHHCHSWQLQGSQVWPFLETLWKEPDSETKHYCHFWEFLGTHHYHSWQLQNEPDLETVTLPLLAIPGNSGMRNSYIATFGNSWAHILPFLATTKFGNITLLPLLAIPVHTSCHSRINQIWKHNIIATFGNF